MAGIGFELRKLLERQTLSGVIEAYLYAGLISSGPWVLSIVGILMIGLLNLAQAGAQLYISQFQVSVTYLITASLILTGILQLTFTRFTADLLFNQERERVMPNFVGLILLTTAVASTLGAALAAFFFGGVNDTYRLLMITGFTVLSAIWVTTIFLSGMKHYRAIVVVFALGYGLTVAATLVWRHWQLIGLLGGFVAGQFCLLLGLIALVLYHFPSRRLLAFEFLRGGRIYPSLMCIGFAYNLGVWIDKFMFWFSPVTGLAVIGPLRASPIYDTPVFLAYLSIIPGMAVFLVRLETDFVDFYQRFYAGVRGGANLNYLERMRREMVVAARQGVRQIMLIQALTSLIVLAVAAPLLGALGISLLYLPLFHVNLISAALQVVFLGQMNILFYLDKRRTILFLVTLFLLSNAALTGASLWVGPKYYGYGFALALALVVLLGFRVLDRRLDTLEYDTFMLQR